MNDGFGGHNDDESGKCFSLCPHGFHMKNRHCNKDIVINVHTHNHGSNSNSGSEISDNCYSEIKIAWIGIILRGSNQAVDNIIDKCMGLA